MIVRLQQAFPRTIFAQDVALIARESRRMIGDAFKLRSVIIQSVNFTPARYEH